MQLTVKCCACGAEMATQDCDWAFSAVSRDAEQPSYYGGHCARCQDVLWPKNG